MVVFKAKNPVTGGACQEMKEEMGEAPSPLPKEELQVVEGALMHAPGGIWWGESLAASAGQLGPWWDDLNSCMRAHRVERALKEYWSTRVKGRQGNAAAGELEMNPPHGQL